MKVNLHWLDSFVDLKVGRDELLRRINTQLGEIESVADLGQKYAGATVVKVAEVSAHPKGDKLSLCLIDDKRRVGDVERQKSGLVQVVCGAPNVKAGMLAVWLPPGSIIPNSFQEDGKRIELAAREIRGVLSQGMLASASELDLGVEKETILSIEPSAGYEIGDAHADISDNTVGRAFAEVFHLDTEVIEIENKMFTHRPDCFGLLGVAREIAAITGSPFKSSELRDYYSKTGRGGAQIKKGGGLKLDIRCPDLVARFQAHVIRGIRAEPSTNIYERGLLASVGLKPVNNVVDKTNLVMYLSGQPTHAFDFDKLLALSNDAKAGLKLVVRRSEAGEKLALLNGKTLTFDQPAVVIATDREPVALGGIMGGVSTEIDSESENVLLECANFSMYDIRRTTMHYGVFSEAATRFTKCQSPGQIPGAAAAASAMIARFPAESKIEPEVEVYEFAVAGPAGIGPLTIAAGFVNQRLGTDFPAESMAELLRRVEFKVDLKGKDSLEIGVPFWRTDIEIAEDIVEEVGRLSGYGEIKPDLPRRPIQAPPADTAGRLLNFKDRIRQLLAVQGANEAVTHSFVAVDSVRRAGQDPEDCFHLINPLNPHLEVYRQSLTPSLTALAEANRRAGWRQFALFEIGSGHRRSAPADEEGLPLDLQRTALVYCDGAKEEGSPFFVARRYLDLLAANFGLRFNYRAMAESPPEDSLDMHRPYEPAASALVDCRGSFLGIVGLLKAGAGRFAGWELETDILLELVESRARESAYQPLAKYPGSSQDITLKVPLKLPHARLAATLEKALAEWGKQNWRAELRPLSIFRPPVGGENAKHVSFRLTAGHKEYSIRKEEVSEILAGLLRAANLEHGAEQIL